MGEHAARVPGWERPYERWRAVELDAVLAGGLRPGELAGVPNAAPVLAGLGVDELSMAPRSIPIVKERLLSITSDQARELAREAIGARR